MSAHMKSGSLRLQEYSGVDSAYGVNNCECAEDM